MAEKTMTDSEIRNKIVEMAADVLLNKMEFNQLVLEQYESDDRNPELVKNLKSRNLKIKKAAKLMKEWEGCW